MSKSHCTAERTRGEEIAMSGSSVKMDGGDRSLRIQVADDMQRERTGIEECMQEVNGGGEQSPSFVAIARYSGSQQLIDDQGSRFADALRPEVDVPRPFAEPQYTSAYVSLRSADASQNSIYCKFVDHWNATPFSIFSPKY